MPNFFYFRFLDLTLLFWLFLGSATAQAQPHDKMITAISRACLIAKSNVFSKHKAYSAYPDSSKLRILKTEVEKLADEGACPDTQETARRLVLHVLSGKNFEPDENPFFKEVIHFHTFGLGGDLNSVFACSNSGIEKRIRMSFPDIVLTHGTGIEELISILESRKIGYSVEDINRIRRSPEMMEELSTPLCIKILRELHHNHEIYPTRNYFQLFHDGQELKKKLTRPGNFEIYFVMKPEVLARGDYHASFEWPYGRFQKCSSYLPGEIHQFLESYSHQRRINDRDPLNEIVFRNPISLDHVSKIFVSEQIYAQVQEILDRYQIDSVEIEKFQTQVELYTNESLFTESYIESMKAEIKCNFELLPLVEEGSL
jgi:hypothetical protein